MGCLNSTPSKDADDKSLDTIRMKRTRIPEFDELFRNAADPLNRLVDLNNAVDEAVGAVQEAAAALGGAYKLRLDETPSVKLVTQNDEGKEVDVDEAKLNEFKSTPEASKAFTDASKACEELAKLVGDTEGASLTIKRGKLVAEWSGEEDIPAALENKIISTNTVIFAFRKVLLAANAEGGIKQAIQDVYEQIKEAAEEACKIEVNLHSNGSIDVGLAGGFNPDLMPPVLRTCWDAIMALVDAFGQAAEAIPGLTDELAALSESASGFPGQARDLATKAGLPPTQLPRAARSTTANVSKLAGAPAICSQLLATLKSTGEEIKEAVA